MNTQQKKYRKLDETSKTLLQILAFQHTPPDLGELTKQCKSIGLPQDNGKATTQKATRESLSELTRLGLLHSQSKHPVPSLMDILIRDGLASAHQTRFLRSAKTSSSWVRRNPVLDYYVAFYTQDAEAWNTAQREIPIGSLPLLTPFCEQTFEAFSAAFQHEFFARVIPAWIVGGEGNSKPRAALRNMLNEDAPIPGALLPRLLE